MDKWIVPPLRQNGCIMMPVTVQEIITGSWSLVELIKLQTANLLGNLR